MRIIQKYLSNISIARQYLLNKWAEQASLRIPESGAVRINQSNNDATVEIRHD